MKTIHTLPKLFLFLLFIAGICISATNPSVLVNGTITIAGSNTPLRNVTVKVNHSGVTTTSNAQGHYSITARTGDSLTFSLPGYLVQNIKITSSKHNVQMGKQDMSQSIEDLLSNKIMSQQLYSCEEEVESQTIAYSSTIGRRAPINNQQNSEEYGKLPPNNFFQVIEQPLSTFSIDVDAASYSNMRRFINNGTLPPTNSIRSEELINYFTYNYPQPTGTDPVSITTEIAGCPWNNHHRLVRIGIKARDTDKKKLPPSNLVFLIDVSGSMDEPNKLPLLQASMKLLVGQLRENDRVAIVTYAGYVKEILPSTSGKNKRKIIEALEQLTAYGRTAGESGIKKAYHVARQNFITGGNNRVILATDGDFNVGISSEEELETLIESERKSEIFLTVLGYGMGNYKDNRMQILAQKGNGNHAYIDNLTEAKKVLVNEFGGTLFTVAKDVKLQIEFNPAKVQAYRLIGYESRLLNKEDFNDDTKDAGEIGSGHTVTALYEIIPVGAANLVDKLKYQSEVSSKNNNPELLTVKLRYKQPDGKQSLKMEQAAIDHLLPLEKSSGDFRFSAAVAAFGMLLNHSPHIKDFTFEQVSSLAKQSVGEDTEGYRKEFIRLVETASLMTDNHK